MGGRDPPVPHDVLEGLLAEELSHSTQAERSAAYADRIACVAYDDVLVLLTATGAHGELRWHSIFVFHGA